MDVKRCSIQELPRDCLEIPDRYYSGVPRVVETEPESLFCRLGCHQTRTLKSPLAIFQTVSLGNRVNRGIGGALDSFVVYGLVRVVGWARLLPPSCTKSPAYLSAGVLYTPALFWPYSHLVAENTLSVSPVSGNGSSRKLGEYCQ